MKRRVFAVSLLLAALLTVFFMLTRARWEQREAAAAEEASATGPEPTESPAPMPAATPMPTPAATPAPTATPIPEATADPAAVGEWTISFAGDCTIATLHEWQNVSTAANMLHVIGDDMGYPLEKVKEIFESDDLTVVNLEGCFTEATEPKNKSYRFRADPAYAAVLTAGGVEAVSLANNHSGDYGDVGYADTKAALEAEGIGWTDELTPCIVTMEGGLKLGFLSFSTVEIDLAAGDVAGYMQRMEPVYTACREAGCDVVIALLHWGWEYCYEPEGWMVELAHRLAELGCDMVVGGHAHVLQPVEVYEGVPICYSLGNFCFGGNSNPDDKDSVIVQQTIWRTAEGVSLGPTHFLPCAISGKDSYNDFCPRLYEPGGADYARVLKKLGLDQEN